MLRVVVLSGTGLARYQIERGGLHSREPTTVGASTQSIAKWFMSLVLKDSRGGYAEFALEILTLEPTIEKEETKKLNSNYENCCWSSR